MPGRLPRQGQLDHALNRFERGGEDVFRVYAYCAASNDQYGRTRYDLFEPDREANTLKITEKMENAKRINSLSRLSIAVTTGTNGTDNTVQFCIAAKPRLVDGKVDIPILRGPFSLDKSCYNDFESGDHDVYDISFDRIYDVEEISDFIIKRKSGTDLLRLDHIWVRAADENNGDQVCLADADLKNVGIGTGGFIFSMNQ